MVEPICVVRYNLEPGLPNERTEIEVERGGVDNDKKELVGGVLERFKLDQGRERPKV